MIYSQHDEDLVAKAKASHYIDWGELEELAVQCQSDEAADHILSIMKRNAHREEYLRNMDEF